MPSRQTDRELGRGHRDEYGEDRSVARDGGPSRNSKISAAATAALKMHAVNHPSWRGNGDILRLLSACRHLGWRCVTKGR